MFTGIVNELGRVVAIHPHGTGALLTIDSPLAVGKCSIGSSIAVNGVCLTVTQINDNHWVADVVTETMSKTTMGSLSSGDFVNIETPLTVGGTVDGHFVQGHVDGVARITSLSTFPDGSVVIRFECAEELLRYIVPKGSITVDGISLTVVSVDEHTFSIAMIPHTGKQTTLGLKSTGDIVNVEVDILAKYIEKLSVIQKK